MLSALSWQGAAAEWRFCRHREPRAEIDTDTRVGYSDSSEIKLEGALNGSGYARKAQEEDEVGLEEHSPG
jgi:hypothetical protein